MLKPGYTSNPYMSGGHKGVLSLHTHSTYQLWLAFQECHWLSFALTPLWPWRDVEVSPLPQTSECRPGSALGQEPGLPSCTHWARGADTSLRAPLLQPPVPLGMQAPAQAAVELCCVPSQCPGLEEEKLCKLKFSGCWIWPRSLVSAPGSCAGSAEASVLYATGTGVSRGRCRWALLAAWVPRSRNHSLRSLI